LANCRPAEEAEAASCSSKRRVAFHPESLRQAARFQAQNLVDELRHRKVPDNAKLLRTLRRRRLAGLGKQRRERGVRTVAYIRLALPGLWLGCGSRLGREEGGSPEVAR
jgi:hypothetical protein